MKAMMISQINPVPSEIPSKENNQVPRNEPAIPIRISPNRPKAVLDNLVGQKTGHETNN